MESDYVQYTTSILNNESAAIRNLNYAHPVFLHDGHSSMNMEMSCYRCPK